MAITNSVVVLTQGGREAELAQLVDSLDLTSETEAILVGNGVTAVAPQGWRYVESATNLGVPGGRNFGAKSAQGDYLIFIDDDAAARVKDLVRRVQHRFEEEPDLAIIGFRIVKPGSWESQRRWTPHVGLGDTTTTVDVTTFVGGGHAIRRSVFDMVGGYYEPLHYALEETDLSWRILDAGWRVSFDADLILEHPDLDQARHAGVAFRTARNRVWIARRLLPFPLHIVYVVVWMVIQLVRCTSFAEVKESMSGARHGWRSAVDRDPIQWATVRRMARLGRPPAI